MGKVVCVCGGVNSEQVSVWRKGGRALGSRGGRGRSYQFFSVFPMEKSARFWAEREEQHMPYRAVVLHLSPSLLSNTGSGSHSS